MRGAAYPQHGLRGTLPVRKPCATRSHGYLLPCPHELDPSHTTVAVRWLPGAPALAGIVRRPTSTPRLMAEAFIITLAVIALVWLAWVAFWLTEHRW
jgi:hypothetical protein